MQPRSLETAVLIVGAGPVGLALAADLGWRGVSCLVVEQGEGPPDHPRASALNARSMEFMRRFGIADAVRAASAPRSTSRSASGAPERVRRGRTCRRPSARRSKAGRCWRPPEALPPSAP